MVQTLWTPPEVIASWPPPNYLDPQHRGPGLLYCSIILTSTGFLVVAARLYARFIILRAPGIDDLLIVVAAAFGIALTVLVIIANAKFHTGYHIWDIDPSTGAASRLNLWISQWCYLYSTAAIKISVLLFCRRLSVPFNRPFYWAVWAGIAYNIAVLVGYSIVLLTMCQPVEAYWMSFDIPWLIRHDGNRHCIYEGISITLNGVFSVVGDFYATLLPTVLVARLQMPIRKKLAVMLLFAVGYAVVGIGIVRTILLNRVVAHDYDYTWVLWLAWIWTLAELWVGLIAASAPALKPLISRCVIEPMTSARGSGTGERSSRTEDTEMQKSGGVGSWKSLYSSRSSATTANTESINTISKPSVSVYSHKALDWLTISDVEKNAHNCYDTIALPHTHDFQYHGGVRCWSDADGAFSPKKSLKSKQKRSSGEQIEVQGRMPTGSHHHRRHHTADSPGTSWLLVGKGISNGPARNAISHDRLPSSSEVGTAFNVACLVEWPVSNEQRQVAGSPADDGALTGSSNDPEQGIECDK